MSIKLKNYTWVKNFIEDYKNYLEETYQDTYYQFNLAKYYYETGELKKALRILIQHSFEDKILNISSKIIALKIYFEQGEFNALDATLESTKMYILREKFVGYQKDSFMNFVKVLRKLAHTNSYSDKIIQKYQDEIHKKHPLLEKSWLLGQLELMKK